MAKSQNAKSEIQKTSKSTVKPTSASTKVSQAVHATDAEIAALAGPPPTEASTPIETVPSEATVASPVPMNVKPMSPVDIVAREIQAFDVGYQTRVQQEHEEREHARQQAVQAVKPDGEKAQNFRQQLETKSGIDGQRFELAISTLYGKAAISHLGADERSVLSSQTEVAATPA